MTSSELKVKTKSADIAGLQLADLIAPPSRREILLANNLIGDDRDMSGNQICSILQKNKYLRSPKGKIPGYGTKLLP